MFVSYAPSDIAARHPKAAKALKWFMIILLIAWIVPKLDGWYLDMRTDRGSFEQRIEQIEEEKVMLAKQFETIEQNLCGFFRKGIYQIKEFPTCGSDCTPVDQTDFILIDLAVSYERTICLSEPFDGGLRAAQTANAILGATPGQ